MDIESVLRRLDRLSNQAPTRAQTSCDAMRRGAMGIDRMFAGSDGERHLEALRVAEHPEAAEAALDAAENAARMLWQALDGIDARRNALAIA